MASRPPSSYVELHLHSCYSLREGASTPMELLDRAVALGYDTLALTDHDGLYGAMEFAREANDRGIQPITGAEITLTGGHHLTLLVESPRGYANLCRLISHGHGTPLGTTYAGAVPDNIHEHDRLITIDPALLARHAEGLIALSGCCRGEVPALVAAQQPAEALAAARRYAEWFGSENFFIELQQNFVYGDTVRNTALTTLARELRISTVATNNVHYHERARARLHDVLVAIRHRTTLDASHRLRRANAEFYLRSPEQMATVFRRYPEAVRATRRIADRCTRFNLAKHLQYSFPHYPVPDGYTPDSYLGSICHEALGRKYTFIDRPPEAENRLREELRLIAKHGLAGFFLTYRDILALAGEIAHELRGRDPALSPDERPVGRGRGSSVSSIVCFLIGLSHVDPVRHKLFLGRFLNDEMISVPDIDLDFPRDIRAALIERMYERYPERVGLVCILPTYKLRSAIRDVGKVLGLPAIELDKLAKVSEGYARAGDLAQEMARLPEFRDKVEAPVWRDLIALAGQLAGFPRHVSQHVGGMVLAAGPIAEVVPVQPARMPGRFLIQWDKDSADDARFVKIDFLALGMLSLVDECLDTIEARIGRRPDFNNISYADKAVFDRIRAADTAGIFQIESRAQMQTLPHTQPQNIDDLAVQVAIVRPGPIVGGGAGSYREYRRRSMAGEPVDVQYDHKLLEPVLEETLGLILFQDQVLEAAMAVAGFTAGQAESLRRSMSRRRSHEAMQLHWPEFLAGATARGVPADTAKTIFAKLLGFSEFGFPKSHAVAFARLAYESAWLRHHHPVEFYCALFNNQPMGFYTIGVLTGDARRHGIAVLSPDINVGGVKCTVESDTAFRLGLSNARGVDAVTAEAVVSARGDWPFRSLFEFVQRTGVHRTVTENLILAGGFDHFGLGRRELLWQLGLFAKGGTGSRGMQRERQGRQLMLPLLTEGDTPSLRPMSPWETLVADHYTLDFSPSMHPLSLMRERLGEGIHTSRHLERTPHGAPVRLAGLVVSRQRPGTAKGVLFMLLEDEFGMTNVIVHPGLYERQRTIVRREPFVVVDGTMQRNGPTISVLARSLTPLRPPPDLVAPASHDFR